MPKQQPTIKTKPEPVHREPETNYKQLYREWLDREIYSQDDGGYYV